MKQEKLKESLNQLAGRTAEPAPPSLAENIKQRIPAKLAAHRGGMDTINIIIDLRVNKLTAAVVIIITMILLANFFGSRGLPGDGLFQDSKIVFQYILGASAGRNELSAVRSRYECLVNKGNEAVYYGDKTDVSDSNAVLLQWKLSDGQYKVITGDLQEKAVSAEELIRLQAEMLQKKIRR